jgi:hypothetical protein
MVQDKTVAVTPMWKLWNFPRPLDYAWRSDRRLLLQQRYSHIFVATNICLAHPTV